MAEKRRTEEGVPTLKVPWQTFTPPRWDYLSRSLAAVQAGWDSRARQGIAMSMSTFTDYRMCSYADCGVSRNEV